MSHNYKLNSNLPQLNVPEFKPNIPDALLTNLSPEIKWMMEQQSVVSQKADWLIKQSLDMNSQVRTSDSRINNLESWRDNTNKNVEQLLTQKEVIDDIKIWKSRISHGWGGLTFMGIVTTGIIGGAYAIIRIVDAIKNLW